MKHIGILSITMFLAGIISISCSNSSSQSESKPIKKDTLSKEIHPESGSGTATPILPAPIQIIFSGAFHQEEVEDSVAGMKWTGLFKGKNGYYLKQTRIRLRHVHDPILDEEESQKTGWEISTPGKDTNILLISEGAQLTERKIQHITLSKNALYPGDTVSFQYQGINYTLFATGKTEQEPGESEWYTVSDYKLYLTARINGKRHKSLLSKHRSFDANMVSVLFIGDLDGDEIIDLILDNSNHYNAFVPALYLSGKAFKGEIVKKVADHTSVGC